MSLYQDIVLSDRPSLYLPMDEVSGSFIDVTGNGYDAAVSGAISRNSTAFTVDGKGGAVSTGGYAVAEKARVPFKDSWTVELWMGNTAPTSWFTSAQSLSWIVSFPGDLTRIDGTRNTMAHVMYYWYYWAAANLSVGVSEFQNTQLVAIERDDANSYGWTNSGSNWIQSGTTINSGRRHLVLRQSSGFGPSDGTNPTSIWNNGAYLGTCNNNRPSMIRPSHLYGFGLFGRPSSLQTIYAAAAQTTWLSNVAMYDYCLSDAQVLKHYQAGAGTLSGQNRVAGTTLLDGVATGGFPVFVHRRDTGALLGRTTSDINGAFSCNVGSYAGQVYAVCFDTVSGMYFPAQVFDLIIPST